MACIDTFTAVGILFHTGAARMEAGMFDGPSSDVPELRIWALAFLDRWSSSSALAARYSSLLRHYEQRLAERNDSRSRDSCGILEAGTSSEDPFDAMTTFPDIDSTFLWTSGADGMDQEAWKWDSELWNIDYRALSQSL